MNDNDNDNVKDDAENDDIYIIMIILDSGPAATLTS